MSGRKWALPAFEKRLDRANELSGNKNRTGIIQFNLTGTYAAGGRYRIKNKTFSMQHREKKPTHNNHHNNNSKTNNGITTQSKRKPSSGRKAHPYGKGGKPRAATNYDSKKFTKITTSQVHRANAPCLWSLIFTWITAKDLLRAALVCKVPD